MTEGKGGENVPPSDRSADGVGEASIDWRAVFGHSDPYADQADGIETVIRTARESGFVALEGACGTGKTMLALTAGLTLVRDAASEFDRVVVLTSVKQQLRQFEADLRTINEGLGETLESVSGLTLVGKADVCPYARERAGGINEQNVYERCDGLRERTRNLAGDDGPTTTASLVGQAQRGQTGLSDSGTGSSRYLQTAGEPTPFLPKTPKYGGNDEIENGTEFCPFYAKFLDDLPADGDQPEAVPFDVDRHGLVDAEELVRLAAGYGSCPHSVMGALLEKVEVVIANYYHAFDPVTAANFTAPLLDDSTFVVCDEAHMLEPRVRDLVSDGVAESSLRQAESELTRMIQPLEFDDSERTASGTDPERIRGELADTTVSLDDLKRARAFIRDVREEMDRLITDHLDRVYPEWRSDLTGLEDENLPLRDPETPAEDALAEWARQAGYDESDWLRVEAVGAAVARVLDGEDSEDTRRAAPVVGRTLASWARLDHETYFRELRLERTWDESEPSDSWRRAYNARLELHNCVPADAIGERLGEFGGGVLMSATLAPLDVFREVTGLNHLVDDGRPVVERTYGLSFPDRNRASFAVDTPKFTYDNRGPPGSENPCRQAHLDAAVTVVETTPGNVLVGMPNYREAEWIATALRRRVEKPVVVDESSNDTVTERLKTEFFSGEAKVLVTSIRGTLTEGVDYRGDRLAAVVVHGVPLINTAAPRTKAMRTAYDRRFGNGFETALTVPAVRKARQAIGRVIRGPDEVGARVLVDARYARDSWDSVRNQFPKAERDEFRPVSSDMLRFGIEQFWETKERSSNSGR